MTALLANPQLPGLLHNIAHPSAQALGALGEQLCYHLLTARGYTVSGVHPGEHRGDLRAITPAGEVLRVEVKTARRSRDGKWRFLLRKANKTDCSHSDVVILLCAMKTGYVVPFVIPTPALARRQQACITSDPYNYAGKYARYRQPMHSLSLEES